MLQLGKKIAGIALGGMLLVGPVAGSAFADAGTQSPPDPPNDQYYQEFIIDFAANLGISQDQVTAALEATKKQIAQENVQQGKMTQAEADQFLAHKGFAFGMGGPRHQREKGDITKDTNFLNNAAGVLGITSDELKTELQSGKKLNEVIAGHGMTEEQFRQKMPRPQRPPVNANEAGDTSN